jgi:hypothetical protein
VVLFAHASGSSRQSPQNRTVARRATARRLATALVDLLTRTKDDSTPIAASWFDINLLVGGLSR